MGRIVIIKDFARALRENGARVSDVVVDSGGGFNSTVEHYSSPGDDSFPMLTDYGVVVDVLRNGGGAIIGYADIKNVPKSLLGEKRIYSRDVNGDTISEIWLKADGSIVVSNDNGTFELKLDGSIDMNGVTIDTSGNVVIPGTLSVGGKDFTTHIHLGSATAPTGAISNTGLLI